MPAARARPVLAGAGALWQRARDRGFPARETFEDFRVLVADQLPGAPSRPRAVRNAPARRPGRGKRRGR